MIPVLDGKPPNSLLVHPKEDSHGYLESRLLGDRALFLLERGVTGTQLKYLKLGRSMGKLSGPASGLSHSTKRVLHIKLIAGSLKINKIFL